jgi:5,10-methylene-tetrahydrofolate dehydrogenase/methenyl tetrahydrofolate cyclohydrolase
LYNELSDSENQAYLETLVKNQLGFLQVELITTDVHRVIDETFLREEQTVLAEALQAIEHLEQHPELEAMLANLPIPNSQATKSERIQWVKAHKESVQALLIDRMVRREDDY